MSIDPTDLEPRSRSSCAAWCLLSAALAATSAVMFCTREGSMLWLVGGMLGGLGMLEAVARWPRGEEHR